ncbi:Uncharacterized protein BP5553_10268 [Venustampulla echinocandica]|uniref:Magnesium transport protein CorA, transmembrane region n=1 Tax=Venustampulla echinocandica TaxID=2656787 RepID=A0A370T9Q6_9HELO|nr:Uncharacterized protein BP5553_10268 [Venustampulla echinocandica]RDL30390.1 Uncharacterized protein BP5553_10268 [Venustampulla echinocandica]
MDGLANFHFQQSVSSSKYVREETSYLEMFSYSDPTLNTIEEHPLDPEGIIDFVNRSGTFQERILPDGVTLIGGMRLLLQKNSRHPETFAPNSISIEPQIYTAMINGLQLPPEAIEMSACVGPLFWSSYVKSDQDSNLHLVYRKSDVRKKGYTRGWELILGHNINTAITTGFLKGTPSSDIVECIKHLKSGIADISHPLILPLIILGHDSSSKAEIKQREARDWLRRLEYAIIARRMTDPDLENYVENGVMDVEAINRDLTECNSQVLWKRPEAYLRIVESMELTATKFINILSVSRRNESIEILQTRILSRLDLYRKKWQGMETYSNTTLKRLDLQRAAFTTLIAQRESKLNFEMAGDQKRLAWATKRDSSSMKGLSLLATVLLPGAYLSSIFSTTFFNFQNAQDMTSVISPRFWIYWVVTVPVTCLIVGLWYMWEKRRMMRYEREDMDLDDGAAKMEEAIMAAMRKRTMSKTPV